MMRTRHFSLIVLLLSTFMVTCGKQNAATLEKEILHLESRLQNPDQGIKTAYERRYYSEQLIDVYRKLVKAYPEHPQAAEYLYRAGMVYADVFKDFEACVAVLQQAANTYKTHPFGEKALFLAGYTFSEQLNDLDRAKATYTLFTERYPNSELLPSVQFELQHLGKPVDQIIPNIEE